MIQTKYAIVIVTYNRKQLLHECIENVQKQTMQASSIIIINNASTDTTGSYLETLQKENTIYDIVNLPENIGGAGGFAKGIERSLEKNVDCVLLIDDDAMIAEDYMEQILQARQSEPVYQAFAGTVKTNDIIDTFHRRTISKVGMLFHNCSEEEYQQPYFLCEVASFCGMVLDISLIKQIGLPHAEYFIWHDDAEYSLRVRKYSKFLVVTNAVLNHKTKQNATTYPRRYNWKDYYAVRNRIWLFGLVKRDSYDWKNEKDMVKKAVRDADKLNM